MGLYFIIYIKPGLFLFSILDADKGANSQLTYSLTSGDTSFFQISNNGVITTAPGKTFDRENKDSYTVTVTARDNSVSGQRSNTARVDITVLDVNDNKPQFISIPISVNVNEDKGVSQSVAKVSATDRDTGKFGATFTFLILITSTSVRKLIVKCF